MITNVSMPITSKNVSLHSAPSFGFAKLNEVGRASADSFEYRKNDFLNGELFKKQGFFKQSALRKALLDGDSGFSQLCTDYGCTNNPKANADFIVNQILSSKSSTALRNIDENEKTSGLLKLYTYNYDNPQLSLADTKKLLELAKDSMAAEDYIKNVGILQAGTDS